MQQKLLNVIEFIRNSCQDNECGVLITTHFGQLLGYSKHPEVLHDLLLVSDQIGVHLITCVENSEICSSAIAEYSKSVGSKLDDLLKGCMAERDTEQFLLVRHVISPETFQNLDFDKVPVPTDFRMYPSKLKSVLFTGCASGPIQVSLLPPYGHRVLESSN